MKLAKLTFLTVSLSIAAWPTTAAESPADAARGEELMRRALEALGGEARHQVRSLRAVADCTRGEREFTTEVTSRRPDRTIFAQRTEDREAELWVLGDEGFLIDLATGERQDLNEPQKAMARGHEFHFLVFELDQRFGNLRVGTDTASGRACTAVAAEDEAGRAAEICFDDENGLPLVLTYEPPGSSGISLRIVFEEWREIDGVLYLSAFSCIKTPRSSPTGTTRSSPIPYLKDASIPTRRRAESHPLSSLVRGRKKPPECERGQCSTAAGRVGGAPLPTGRERVGEGTGVREYSAHA